METVWNAYGNRTYARMGRKALTIQGESVGAAVMVGWHPPYGSLADLSKGG